MKTLLTLVGLCAVGAAQEPPPIPRPAKEHEWLKALEGEWATDGECVTEPGKPQMKMKGTAWRSVTVQPAVVLGFQGEPG